MPTSSGAIIVRFWASLIQNLSIMAKIHIFVKRENIFRVLLTKPISFVTNRSPVEFFLGLEKVFGHTRWLKWQKGPKRANSKTHFKWSAKTTISLWINFHFPPPPPLFRAWVLMHFYFFTIWVPSLFMFYCNLILFILFALINK